MLINIIFLETRPSTRRENARKSWDFPKALRLWFHGNLKNVVKHIFGFEFHRSNAQMVEGAVMRCRRFWVRFPIQWPNFYRYIILYFSNNFDEFGSRHLKSTKLSLTVFINKHKNLFTLSQSTQQFRSFKLCFLFTCKIISERCSNPTEQLDVKQPNGSLSTLRAQSNGENIKSVLRWREFNPKTRSMNVAEHMRAMRLPCLHQIIVFLDVEKSFSMKKSSD